jgi:hypothetical protein
MRVIGEADKIKIAGREFFRPGIVSERQEDGHDDGQELEGKEPDEPGRQEE